MIHVTKIDKLSYFVRFDPAMTNALTDASGWGSHESAICSILFDALLGPASPSRYLNDVDDDVPF